MQLLRLAGYPAPLLLTTALTWPRQTDWAAPVPPSSVSRRSGVPREIRCRLGGAVVSAGLATVDATVRSRSTALPAVVCPAVAGWLIAGARGVSSAWRVRRSPRPTGADAE
jgi:hypothetical protein